MPVCTSKGGIKEEIYHVGFIPYQTIIAYQIAIHIKNADEKIKLWLFLPGRYSSVVDTAQAAVCRLKGIACS